LGGVSFWSEHRRFAQDDTDEKAKDEVAAESTKRLGEEFSP